MFDCIPRVETESERVLLFCFNRAARAKSNDSAIKFEWNCPVLNRTCHVMWSDWILGREKAYISIGFSSWIERAKNYRYVVWSSASNTL